MCPPLPVRHRTASLVYGKVETGQSVLRSGQVDTLDKPFITFAHTYWGKPSERKGKLYLVNAA